MVNILNEDFLVFKNFDALLIDDVTGRVIAKDKLDSGSIDVKVEAKEVRAGKNNSVIATIGGNRDMTIKFEEPVFNLETLAMQVGQDVIDEGIGIAYAMGADYEVGVGKRIELENTPIDGTIVFANKGVTGTVVEDSKAITLTGAGVEVGGTVRISTYQYATSAKTQTINIEAGKFATAKKVILENTVYSLDEVEMGKIQYVFPKAKPSGNFQIDVKGGDASKNSMEFKVLESNGRLAQAIFIPKDSTVASVVSGDIFVSPKTITGRK